MSDRRVTVYAAIASNLAIAVTKFFAAAISGSTALFSEGLHSVVDTGDGLLVLLGLYLSRKPPTAKHPYGRGSEIYFWSMVVAMCIFGIGGCASIYEGITHLHSKRQPVGLALGLGALAIAFVFEGASWLIAVRGFRRAHRELGVIEAIESSKDPTTFVVVLEDSAALAGVLAAAIGITLSHVLHAPVWDAIASIVIGTLLVGVGIVLGRETWSLLLGESASREVVQSIRDIARSQPGVADARMPRTMHIGPDVVHVDLDVVLADEEAAVDVARGIEQRVRARHPKVRRVTVRFPDRAELAAKSSQ